MSVANEHAHRFEQFMALYMNQGFEGWDQEDEEEVDYKFVEIWNF